MQVRIIISLISTLLLSCNNLPSLTGTSSSTDSTENQEPSPEIEITDISEPVSVAAGFLHCNSQGQEEEVSIACSVIDEQAKQISLNGLNDSQLILVTSSGENTGISFNAVNTTEAHWLSEPVAISDLSDYRVNPVGIKGLASEEELIPISSSPFGDLVATTNYIEDAGKHWFLAPPGNSCRSTCRGRGGSDRTTMNEDSANSCLNLLQGSYAINLSDADSFAGLGRGCLLDLDDGNVFTSSAGASGVIDLDFSDSLFHRLCACNSAVGG